MWGEHPRGGKRNRGRHPTGVSAVFEDPSQGMSAQAPSFVCAVEIERGDKWEHCDGKVICRFEDGRDDVLLCRRCARNVLRGDYGTRLQAFLIEQSPEGLGDRLIDRF